MTKTPVFLSTILLSGAALLGACTQTPMQAQRAAQVDETTQMALDKELAGLVPDPTTTTCLPTLTRTQVKGYGKTLVYSAGSSLKYRSDTTGGCEGVGRGDILVTVSNGGRTCQGDIARTIDQASRFPTGGCGIGPFTAYRKPR